MLFGEWIEFDLHQEGIRRTGVALLRQRVVPNLLAGLISAWGKLLRLPTPLLSSDPGGFSFCVDR